MAYSEGMIGRELHRGAFTKVEQVQRKQGMEKYQDHQQQEATAPFCPSVRSREDYREK
jgi:hypothetical protein